MFGTRTTVAPRHVALHYRDGAQVGLLTAGTHRLQRSDQVVHVDLRERLLTLSPQEILTSDALSVRVSAVVRFAVTDPVAWVEIATDPEAVIYLATQVSLRDALAGLTADELVARGSAVPTEAITAAATEAGARVGAQVAEVAVKDLILPGELKQAAAELATARRRGQAQLETARAETAALRSLANGARVLDAHPALANIRLVQAAAMGSQVVLHLGATAATVEESDEDPTD